MEEVKLELTRDIGRGKTMVTASFDDMSFARRGADAIVIKAMNLMVEKYVEERFQEVAKLVDPQAIANQVALGVTAALTEKTIAEALAKPEENEDGK